MKVKIYNDKKNVYQASKERIAYIFDKYQRIVVSFSGGKDSTVLLFLSLEEAKQRNRKIYVFYIDQEVEYNSTINMIDETMKDENIIPLWFQIPGIMATAINHQEYLIYPWDEKEKYRWVRSQKRISIKKITWEHDVKFACYDPLERNVIGFYGQINCMEQMFNGEETAFLIGLRAEESLNRFRAVTQNPGIEGINWSVKNKYGGIKFYPIYDWTFADLWIYLSRNKIKYNKMYDYFWKKGYSMRDMRISSLMNRKAFQCLVDVQEFEPKLYDKLLERCNGVKTASLYAKEDKIFKVNKLPKSYKTWKEYRDFLVETLPNKEHAKIFKERFEKQKDNAYVWKQQVYQVHIHDLGNRKRINDIDDPLEKRKLKWMEEL